MQLQLDDCRDMASCLVPLIIETTVSMRDIAHTYIDDINRIARHLAS